MSKGNRSIYSKACFEMLNSEYNDYKPAYIFVKDTKGEKEIIVYGVSSDQETMIRYTGHESIEVELNKETVREILDWSYDINDDFLEYFEKDYHLEFMSIEQHDGMWIIIGDSCEEDIRCLKGLQNYMSHCQSIGINPSLFKQLLGLDCVDIYSLYPEKNIGFEVIDEFTCGNETVVLAMKDKPYHREFVTWRTTPDRKRGYDIGNYFTSPRNAFSDFRKRSQSIFERHFDRKRSKFKIRFRKEEMER
ncbi:hypothetical protein [Longibaculum muris]|uniref:hypothetical protein n=1 Tax=Longibaculum muris TaxID=1796628 RepID=UPI00294324D5|nr:hypothetical protein [Longibaculum muris]